MQKLLQYDLIGEFLASDALKVGKYGFPLIAPNTLIPSGDTLPFNYLLSCENLSMFWFHCFVDDRQFERLWHNFEHYVPILLKVKGLIGTDFSLYRDMPIDWLVWNCRRNRAITYAMQKAGINVIPTAGFAGEETWAWCFDGLPTNSTLAITTNCIRMDPEGKRLFVGGLDALIYYKHPSTLVICGNYPRWVKKKYPQVNIVSIPSFSQLWAKRRCA